MEVQTSVDEADIGKVKQDQRVEFTVDAYPDMKFEGIVSEVRLQPVTTNNVVTYVVILSAPNPEKKLMPGMTASATIYVEEKAECPCPLRKSSAFYSRQGISGEDVCKNEARRTTVEYAGRCSFRLQVPPFGMPAGQTIGMPPAGMAIGAGNADPKTKTVWVKDDKMGIRPNMIKIGIDNGTNVEVSQV